MRIKYNTITFELTSEETHTLKRATEILDEMMGSLSAKDAVNFRVLDDDTHCESDLLEKCDIDSALAVLQTMV